ncbi:gamma-tubulin complex component 4 isoform X2 [Eurytemora carolleeae]|nr:gamma-tubulin complex component 4 isoform X2 [Eurytemora carolleeae]|eukprot:XP_023339634.1 gamma-tubulin complex component 4-like isoform X2 [Eurytemora affinis]
MYLFALYQGLDKSLEPYLQTLVKLEVEILKNSGTQLSLLQHRLLPHRPILRALVQLVREVDEEAPAGCMILDKVYQAAGSGVAGVGTALKLVLSELHKVLYKQLLAWLLQGNLYDPFNEFFIVKDDKADESILLVGEEGEKSRSKSKTFQLRLEMVPQHISHSLAEKIFFIGESIQLFESDRRVEVQGAVLRDREAEFYQELARLRDKTVFEVADFTNFVDKIRETVSEHLHTLMMKEADLMAELGTVWNLFLLGRGELFHTFIRLTEERLRNPPTITTQTDVNEAWRTAAQLILSQSEEENISHKIKVLIGNEPYEGWGQISIQYAVSWPLHLIITPSAIHRYNKIFSFLLLIRRTQNCLNHLWSDMMMKVRRGEREAKEMGGLIWETRQHISFIVSNIQSYVLSDVLETQRAKLVKKLEETKSFETVKEAHEQFLTDVSAHIFLLNPKVLSILKDLLKTALAFTDTVTVNPQGAAGICEELNLKAALLLQLLTSMRQKLQGSHLAQLLLRLDYNRYFSSTKKISSVVTSD